MKKIALLLCLLCTISVYAQDPDLQKMGLTTLEELKMTVYDKDSTASAVILEEKKFVYPSKSKNYNFTKEYYIRIKILDKSAFSYATLEIPYFKSSKLENVEAITYNLDANGKIVKSKLSDDNIFKEKVSSRLKVDKFSLPNVKVGSVIEYKYTVSRNNYKVYNFYFQGSIPSIKTEYTAFLSGRPKYNVRLIGYLKPDFSESVIKKKCIGVYKCIQVKYIMKDIPAFTSEEYMTSKYNFLSRLSFEKEYEDRFVKKGENEDWRTLDKWVKKSLESRLDRKSFYRRKLSDSILNEPDNLKRAKKVFYYIQNHFVLGNNSGKTFSQSHKNRVASSSRINISLYNALLAAGFNDVKFVMLSTRDNGLPTKLHATLDDFNSDLIRIVIDGEKYFLDATDKLMSFGMIPFQSLNGDGRVFDFNKGSYWEPIIPIKNNSLRKKMNLSVDDEGTIIGQNIVTKNGYKALDTRKELKRKGEEIYLEDLETLSPDIEIENYSVENESNHEKTLREVFDLRIEDVSTIEISSLLLLSKVNPFQLKERNYPVDYGYPIKNTYLLNLKLPENFEFSKIPQDHIFALPNKGGSYLQKISVVNNTLSVYIKFQINKITFYANDYQRLKEFYNQVTKAQNSIIQFKKKS